MAKLKGEVGSARSLANKLRELGIANEAVLEAISKVPRGEFLTESFRNRARDNDALPIGYGQTTSAPFVIARMLELALGDRDRLGKVLEIGTGCGYQTALLSLLADEVYSIERISNLLSEARNRLHNLAYTSPRLAHRDGTQGLKEAAPYDAIIICAAMRKMNDELLNQLDEGGKLVVPENQGDHETLMVYTKNKSNAYEDVMFVPMIEGLA